MDCNFKRLLWRQQWGMHSQARGAVALHRTPTRRAAHAVRGLKALADSCRSSVRCLWAASRAGGPRARAHQKVGPTLPQCCCWVWQSLAAFPSISTKADKILAGKQLDWCWLWHGPGSRQLSEQQRAERQRASASAALPECQLWVFKWLKGSQRHGSGFS